MKDAQTLRMERVGLVAFDREDLPGLHQELEGIYNEPTAAGKEPSEKFFKLLIWVKQEAEVLNSPDYDPTFTCETCGYGGGTPDVRK